MARSQSFVYQWRSTGATTPQMVGAGATMKKENIKVLLLIVFMNLTAFSLVGIKNVYGSDDFSHPDMEHVHQHKAAIPIGVMGSHTHAQGEWMTEDWVPFEATIKFKKPATTDGFVMFMRNNPSGKVENDYSVFIPVKFSVK